MKKLLKHASIVFITGFMFFYSSNLFASKIQDTLRVTVSTGTYEIADSEQGHVILAENFGCLLIPGKPVLPSKIFAIAIPPGAEVVDISFDTPEPVTLPGSYDIPPAPLPRVIGDENPLTYAKDKQRYEDNYFSTYQNDNRYPHNIVELVRTAGYRKYNLVDVRISPFAYFPVSKQLEYYPQVNVYVSYRFNDTQNHLIIDNQPRTEKIAEEIIINYQQAQNWYSQHTFDNRNLHDFVIITLESLLSSVAPLASWETMKGRSVEIVTLPWISTTYGGYDTAEKIRNFLRHRYPSNEWGIEDVLIVGHYSDIPMRRTWQDIGYGKPETDFYYAELSQSDLNSWDADEDHRYGEYSDPIDFYAEVNVGRIPWSDPTTVLSICDKSIAYEQNNDPSFKKNILLLGAYFWDQPVTDNAVLMEAKVAQQWMTDWTMTRMYESGYSSYSMDYNLTNNNVISVWSSNTFGFVNWAGHGSPYSSHILHGTGEAFIQSSDCPLLNDNYPAIIFADACSNSDTDYLNLGQAMIQKGAVGFLGATKVALGCPGWINLNSGSSQSLDYLFTTCVTSGSYTIGEAHQMALRLMYSNGYWDYNKYETFEWGALWGNPNLGMSTYVAAPLIVSLPDSVPEYVYPGVSTSITVQILDGTEQYVPGSGAIYYRLNSGDFTPSSLSSLGGDLYEAALPTIDCEDTLGYYFSAEGNSGSVVLHPYNAPASVYTTLAGSLFVAFEDNFETNQGWAVENLGATSGLWQRGVPVNDPGWDYDPISDSDGSGQCFVTQNETGNTDVDDGAVRLTSPVFDMSQGKSIAYDYYLYLTNTTGEVDMMLVEINNNDGVGSWVEIASHTANNGTSWSHNVIEETDLYAAGITLTSTMRIRFTVNDADPQSIVEAGLDAFKVFGLDCESPGYKFLPGDVNMYTGEWPPAVQGGDVTYLVNNFRMYPANLPCYIDGFWASADVNGNCTIDGGDVTALVNIFRSILPAAGWCPDYEPLWHNEAELPDEEPAGWPGCEILISNSNIKAIPKEIK